VAEFWGTLSDDTLFPTPLNRALALENFYYTGLTGFSPVVHHANYGVPFGQVRSNHFLGFNNWQLREWRTGFDGGGAATFLHDTVKQTALTEFYNSTFSPPSGSPLNTPPGLFVSQRTAFQSDFISNQIGFLAAPEAGGPPTSAAQIINGFATAIPAGFNEFQSHAQNGSDVPLTASASGFQTVVNGSAPPGLNGLRLLNRAGTQTCGGCHQFSNGVEIGDVAGSPVFWPSSLTFVHVNESGALSPALNSFFLPARFQILANAVCDNDPEPDGGSPPVPCGGTFGDACDPYSQYCSVCVGPYEVGQCEPRPEICPLPGYGSPPVCGCDGTTYLSECHAHQAGVAVVHEGSCDGSGGSCSDVRPPRGCCFEDAQCPKGGHCVGEVCPRQAGVCEPPVTSRGECWEDSDCGRGAHCEGERVCPCGAQCIVADAPGRCVADPDPCRPMEAKGDGLCRMTLGFSWDGRTCVPVNGCKCEGADCDKLFSSQKACLIAHEKCVSIQPIDPGPITVEPTPILVSPETRMAPVAAPTAASTSTTTAIDTRVATAEASPAVIATEPVNATVAAAGSVKTALTNVRSRIAMPTSNLPLSTKILQLEAAVKTARVAEQAEGGAFVPRRRSH
jgi:hypothetical protein